MNVFWIFIAIVAFCLYVLFGLHMTDGMTSLTQIIMTWVIYTLLWFTLLNVFSLGYFWSVIRTKTGPYGLRGPEGETGIEGSRGECGINASEAYCMKSINDYINNLYKTQTNQDILNEDTQKFPCVYLNEKIQKMAGSRQYQVIVANLSNENKGIDNVVNYLKSIWKEWFDLLYNATNQPGAWFIDEFGDENYEWSGNNPFDEIKKYDIYYWGITRDFRPLKAEICRSSSTYNNSKFPQNNLPQEPRLKIIQSNDYKYVANDRKTGARTDASWYRAKQTSINNETYYPVGDVVTHAWKIRKQGNVKVGDIEYSQPNGTGPDIKSLLVSGDVKEPIGYEDLVGHGGQYRFVIKKIKCPEGYTDMGNIVVSNRYEPNSPTTDKIKCVPTDCVEPLRSSGSGMWDNRQYVINKYTSGDYEAKGDNGYNLMRTKNSLQPFYKIKDKCLRAQQNTPSSTKDVEPQYGDLGIGWNGHPYKLDPKYSIFSFLNLVPEGMMVNKGTGQRFYITHYGGEEDINIYNILAYNKLTNKFDYALQTSNGVGNKEQFEDESGNESNTEPNTFSISHSNGKFISYDTKNNKLSLNNGSELMMDITTNQNTQNTQESQENQDNKDKFEDTNIYSKDNYFINKAYYIDNNKKIDVDTFLNININSKNTINNTKNNSQNTQWSIIDNTDGSVKILNNSGNYIGYDNTTDTVLLVKENDKKCADWYLNSF